MRVVGRSFVLATLLIDFPHLLVGRLAFELKAGVSAYVSGCLTLSYGLRRVVDLWNVG